MLLSITRAFIVRAENWPEIRDATAIVDYRRVNNSLSIVIFFYAFPIVELSSAFRTATNALALSAGSVLT